MPTRLVADRPLEGPAWHFIPHPPAHRAYWRSLTEGQDGTSVMTAFGMAELIVSPTPDDDAEWICDYCSGPIEVYDAYGSPIPVVSHGTYALCGECVGRAIRLGDLSPDARELFGGTGQSFNACGGRCCRPWLERIIQIG